MDRKLDIGGLPIKQQEAIWAIVDKPRKIVDISSLDEDLQHDINKVILKDEIDSVRRFLKQRKEQR